MEHDTGTATTATAVHHADGAAVAPEIAALREHAREVRIARTVGGVLGWDERTSMPPEATTWRSMQRAWVAAQVHDLVTGDRAARIIAAATEAHPDDREVAVLRKEHERECKVPRDLVQELAVARTRARGVWARARSANDFALLEPELDRMLELQRRLAECIGYEQEPYDALLGGYEEGVRARELEALFDRLEDALVPIVQRQGPADRSILRREYDANGKRRLETALLGRIGYDMEAGRVDATVRAFCMKLGPRDVRMTTRFHNDATIEALHSSLHEAGHGIYGQSFARLGLPDTTAGSPSLGMDEAMARAYENLVGRDPGFWQASFPLLVEALAPVVAPHELDAYLHAITASEPGVRRIGSDELTYNLHVALRFRLERDMANGELQVRDLPEAWRAGAQQLLGVAPPDDARGCMQDVHWSIGQWGYFPTYTLGNVYGAQLLRAARAQLGSIGELVERDGNLLALRAWLDEHVFVHGRALTGPEIVERATGEPVSHEPLVGHLQERFGG